MRCPKCGYISFDSQHNCGKCGRDLGEIAALLDGTVSRDSSPEFLAAALAPSPDDESLDVTEDSGPDEEESLFEESLGESPGEEIIQEGVTPAPAEPEPELDLKPELKPEESAVEDLLTLETVEEADGSEIEPTAAGSAEEELDLGAMAANELPDLIGEEPPDELDLSPADTGGQDLSETTDLTDLLDLVGDQPKATPPPEMGHSEIEDITDLLGDPDQKAHTSDNLILEIADDNTPLGAASASESTPEIPDLGLSLESAEEREK